MCRKMPRSLTGYHPRHAVFLQQLCTAAAARDQQAQKTKH